MVLAGAEMRAEEGLNGGGGDGYSVAGVSATGTERTRIYVGGLGESVTEDDLRKTFSSLGEIEAVDIVRTKGRSFAYLDFIPSSDKSLPKLFSTYNGCMWKGGRLRLEKAKEHYLIRLKREWQEEAENASDASKGDADSDADENKIAFEKPKKAPSSEKMQLQIFFPKLRKVKSVAWSGTGKHKYSFQRVEVPAHPVHFCDCEQHYVPPVLKAANGGINEEELNIMNSVMNRLLQKEDSKTAIRESNLPNERDISDKSIDDVPVGDEEGDMTDEEEDMTDEDNLVINVVTRGKNKVEDFGRQSLDAIMADQKSISKKPQTSKEKPLQSMSDSQKKKSLTRSKKQKPSGAEEIVENIGNSLQLPLTTPGNKALELQLGTQQEKSTSSGKQKSAWKKLIDKKGNTQFSLTNILRSGASQKEKEPVTANVDVASITDKKEDEPKSMDLDVPSTVDKEEGKPKTVEIDVPSTTDKKEGEPKTVEIEVPSITEMKIQSLENHGDADIQPDQSKNLEDPAEAPPAKPKEVSNKVARGAAWLAKSSWTQLVSTTINTPFSLSQVLPSLTSEKHEQAQHNSAHVANSTDSGSSTLNPVRNEAREDSSNASGLVTKDLIVAPKPLSSVIPLVKHDNNPTSPGSEQKLTVEKGKEKCEAPASAPEKRQPLTSKQRALGDFEFSETCPFMRTDTSMKEWKKRKVSQSASLRKKRKGDLE